VIGNGSYFWLIRGTIPIVLPATFEKRVNEVIETEDRRVVWYRGRMGINILALDVEYVEGVERFDDLRSQRIEVGVVRGKFVSCPSLCNLYTDRI